MSCWRVAVAALLLAGGLAHGQGGGAAAEIVGTWSGSSACFERQAAPACNDERVVYEIRASSGKPDTLSFNADKIVDGKRAKLTPQELAASREWFAKMRR